MFNDNERLIWQEKERKEVFNSPIFSIEERLCLSPNDTLKVFTVLNAPDWAIIIPVIDTERGKEFVMVRQWRHGVQDLSLEFPGGVFDLGETAEKAALRELEEETAYTADKIIKLGAFNPNPAIMSNKVHIFLAYDLKRLESQHLDEDEYVDVEMIPEKDVLKGMGKAPYIHALMGSALLLYEAYKNN